MGKWICKVCGYSHQGNEAPDVCPQCGASSSQFSYALVGGDADEYLWILSRTPQLQQETLDQLIYEAHRREYMTSHLIWVQRSESSE